MALAKFTIEPQPEKSILSSKTFWANVVVMIIAFMPSVQEFLKTTFPEGEQLAAWTVQIVALLNIVLRVLTKGPISGVVGATGYGITVGTKSLVNKLPFVNIK